MKEDLSPAPSTTGSTWASWILLLGSVALIATRAHLELAAWCRLTELSFLFYLLLFVVTVVLVLQLNLLKSSLRSAVVTVQYYLLLVVKVAILPYTFLLMSDPYSYGEAKGRIMTSLVVVGLLHLVTVVILAERSDEAALDLPDESRARLETTARSWIFFLLIGGSMGLLLTESAQTSETGNTPPYHFATLVLQAIYAPIAISMILVLNEGRVRFTRCTLVLQWLICLLGILAACLSMAWGISVIGEWWQLWYLTPHLLALVYFYSMRKTLLIASQLATAPEHHLIIERLSRIK